MQTLFIIFLLNCSSFGQTNNVTTLTGVVTDRDGAFIPSAYVLLESETKKKFETKTNQDGIYRIDLKPGVYSVKITHIPFSDLLIKDYQIASNRKTMVLDISLICANCEPVFLTLLRCADARVSDCNEEQACGIIYEVTPEEKIQ